MKTGRPKKYNHKNIELDLLYGKVERPLTVREIAERNKCSVRVVMLIKNKLKNEGKR